MSNFTSFARRVDEIAKATFAEYIAAEDALKKAEAKAKEYPQRNGAVTAEYVAKSARAHADLLEARERLHTAQMKMNNGISAISSIRRELAAALNDEYSADPAQIDSGALELLKSGICTAAEYAKMMDTAQTSGNYTMARLIARYAADAAEQAGKQYGQNDQRAMELRAEAYQGKADPAGAKLSLFDAMAEAYQRTASNPAMISAWSELTTPVIENL